MRTVKEWYEVLDKITRGHIPLSGGKRGILQGGIARVNSLIDKGMLSPNSDILDLGCGNGRMAVGLEALEFPVKSYTGIDCVIESVDWCNDVFPDWSFFHLDVHNSFYNPSGSIMPESIHLPIQDSGIDYAVAWSVMTHIERPSAAIRYMSEIYRVLRTGGVACVTWFISENQNMLSGSAKKTVFKKPIVLDMLKRFHIREIAPDYTDPGSGQIVTLLEKM